MKKVVIIFTSMLLIFVIYLAYNEINYKNNNNEISILENKIKKLDNDIIDQKEKNNNLEIDKEKSELLEVWKKEVEKVKENS